MFDRKSKIRKIIDADRPVLLGDGDVTSLRQLQKRLLYGGGTVLTFIMVLTMFVSIGLQAADYRSDQISEFKGAKLTLDSLFIQRDAGYIRTLNSMEYAWRNQHQMLMAQGDARRSDFIDHDERLLIQASPEAMPWLVLGDHLASWPADKLNSYLGLISELSVITGTAMTERGGQSGTVGYFYDPSKSLFAFGRGLTEDQLHVATGKPDRPSMLNKLALPHIDFGDIRSLRESQHGNVLLPFYGAGLPQIHTTFGKSPANGEASVIGSFVVMDENEPIGAVVVYEPADRFARWLRQSSQHELVLLTHDGKAVLGTGSLSSAEIMASQFQAIARRADDGGMRTYRDRGKTFIAEPILGTDWLLVRSFSWWDIIVAEWPAMTGSVVLTLLVLLCLWLLLVCLDRGIFAPALKRAKRVYQSEALNREIIEATPVGLCLVDVNAVIPILQNDLVREYADIPNGLGTSFYRQLLDTYLNATSILPDRPEAREFELTLNAGHADDTSPRHLLIAATPATYKDRRAVLFVLRDLTLRIELEETLRLARHQAELASEAKSSFVAMMSHEIRTPLNGIMGHLELLGKSALDNSQRERLIRLRQSADSLLSVVSDVLDFTKIEAGKLEAETIEFDVREVIERIAYLYAPAAREKGLRFYYLIDPMVSRVYRGSAVRIEQVLRNLVSNAIKFTTSGKVTLRVHVQSLIDPTHEQVCFEVADSGIGMSQQQIALLFEPFVQADASIGLRFGGTGLGLALCRQLSELLGGSMTVASTPDVGSLFSLDIPLMIDTRAMDLREWPLRDMNILLLSSAAEWREEISDLLAAWGARVTVISHPIELTSDMASTIAAVVIFDASWGSWSSTDEQPLHHHPIVRACVDGPLLPTLEEGGVEVSCYASAALLRALQDIHMPSNGGIHEEAAIYAVGQALQENFRDASANVDQPLRQTSSGMSSHARTMCIYMNAYSTTGGNLCDPDLIKPAALKPNSYLQREDAPTSVRCLGGGYFLQQAKLCPIRFTCRCRHSAPLGSHFKLP